jgi:tryptophan halogenase
MLRKVIVLGGGSAGFMAAIALRTKIPALDVLVIRSKDIGIIGVGEGSTIALTRFLHDYLRIGPKRFHEVARPTWKAGLRFLWGPRPYFNYTFGPGMEAQYPDLPKAMGYYCDADVEYSDLYSALMTQDRIFERGPNGAPRFHDAFSYHFENERFVDFLEAHALAQGVRTLDDTVLEVRRDDRGVAALALKSGAVESADLYVDCSGFASLLLGKTLAEPFIPFKSSLFCDRAVVGGWDRATSSDPADQVIRPYTTCETMDAGWCWQIEHIARVNRGYVYSSDFISDDAARDEFTRKNPKVTNTRVVRFVSGRYARCWVDNVIAIGNASGFVEPLEATALGVIAMQSRLLADTLVDSALQPRPTQVREFNDFHTRNWDSIRGFIAVHYKFNTRLQTPFWQACRADVELGRAQPIVEYFHECGPTALWQPTMFDDFDQFKMGGYASMLVGMRVPYENRHQPTESERNLWETKRQRLKEAAQRAMTVRETLELISSPKWKWGEPPAKP